MEKERIETEARSKSEDLERQQRELARMAEEDTPALDAKEVEDLRRKMIEKEEAERRAREAMEEEEDDDEEDESSENDDDEVSGAQETD